MIIINKIIINPALCVGCQVCYKSCYLDVLRWDEEKKMPKVAYPRDCVQCLVCQTNCPVRAIKVTPDYETYRFPREAVSVAGSKKYEYLKGGISK